MTETTAARYIMIGGFLGAGKSTAVLALARHLTGRGRRVGLITNDQSVGLVDTKLMRSAGFNVEEIAGGCFCCRFDSLVSAAEKLGEAEIPDVFVAEPVGSCTDLVASVSYPLRRIYGQRYVIAPLSVVVDPVRAARILGLESGKAFSPKVVYVYRKQLEEADLIVINKADAVDGALVERLREELGRQFPQAEVVAVSARRGDGLAEWFELLEKREMGVRPTMAMDYDTYAEGEALLGWLNATLRLRGDQAFDGEVVMMDLAERIRGDLVAEGAEIAHLKMTLAPEGHGGQVGLLNLVRNDFVAELAQSLGERMRGGELILNLRAEADPARLMAVVEGAIQHVRHEDANIAVELEHVDYFRPARPTPTWRMTDADHLTPHTAGAGAAGASPHDA